MKKFGESRMRMGRPKIAMPAILCAIAFGATISYSSGAAPLKRIIPDLGQQIGMALEVSPEMEWHVLFVRVKNAQPRDVLEEVARASLGTWKQVGKTSRLIPNEAQALAAARAEQKLLKAGLDAADRKRQTSTDPYATLATCIYQSLGSEQLCRILPGQVLTFAGNPTQLQLPMPDIDRAMPGILAEENKQRAYYESNFRASKIIQTNVDLAKFTPIPELPGRAILKLTNDNGTIRGRLVLYDESGAQALRGGFSLGKAKEPETAPIPMQTPKEPKELRLSPVHWLNPSDGKGFDGLRRAALRVGQLDPFLSAATAVCDQYIAGSDENFVLALNEQVLCMPSDKIWIETIRTAFDRTTMVSRRPGWVTRAFAAYPKPVDRDRLGEVLRRMSKSSPSLKDWGFWAASKSRLGSGALTDYFLRTAKIDLERTNLNRARFDALLAAFGNLEESQQDELLKGAALFFAKFPRAAQLALSERFYGYNALPPIELIKLETEHRKWMDGRYEPSEDEKDERSRVGIGLTSITSDPTYSYPAGIPSDAVLRLMTFADSPDEYELRFETKRHGLRLNVRLRL